MTGNYIKKVSDMYQDAYGQIVNLLNITSIDAQNQQQVKDAMVNYFMATLARNKALDFVGNLGAASKPVIGRLEVSAVNVKVIGRQSGDGKVCWRVDYDPEKGHTSTYGITLKAKVQAKQ